MIFSGEKFTPEIVFKLVETYGYPVELTKDTLEKHGIDVDLSNIDVLREKHADKSRSKINSGMHLQIQVIQKVNSNESTFVGYEKTEVSSKVIYSLEEHKE